MTLPVILPNDEPREYEAGPGHLEQVPTNLALREMTLMASTAALSKKHASELQRNNTVTMGVEPNPIAGVAYTLWESRGCPIGSPEEDWFKAEQALASTAGLRNNS
jgi:hypothetical protein